MGRLERKLDIDLIARMRSGVKHPAIPVVRRRTPRTAASYRAARREQARMLGVPWPGLQPTRHALPHAIFKVVDDEVVPRNKQYTPNGKRECERRKNQQSWPGVRAWLTPR